MTEVPLGFRFDPTDEELLGKFLSGMVNGEPVCVEGVIEEKDVYEREPWLLERKQSPHLEKNQWFYFVRRQRVSEAHAKGTRIKRTVKGEAEGGWWHSNGSDTPILSIRDGKVLGYKRTLTFFTNKKFSEEKPGTKRKSKREEGDKSDWIMHEYRLASDTFQDWVVCRIKYRGKEPLSTAEEKQDLNPRAAAKGDGVLNDHIRRVDRNDAFGDFLNSPFSHGTATVAGHRGDSDFVVDFMPAPKKAASMDEHECYNPSFNISRQEGRPHFYSSTPAIGADGFLQYHIKIAASTVEHNDVSGHSFSKLLLDRTATSPTAGHADSGLVSRFMPWSEGATMKQSDVAGHSFSERWIDGTAAAPTTAHSDFTSRFRPWSAEHFDALAQEPQSTDVEATLEETDV